MILLIEVLGDRLNWSNFLEGVQVKEDEEDLETIWSIYC